ncbi:hypothetical protein FE783_08210 [Paenibacillus mesophilus]|uniref:hypothetical protein n=1 Tax=Paenibacillus mesophilus TaxID=2582849 RepID=UPI00110DBAE0|nr:hypothetical protein [Paenibacillus mesophilus]TMV50667.1 hypothetical protein FE783_08210 [Paenibacillus mesophilus]
MKNKWLLLLGLIVFAAFFISSILRESPLLLYIASAIPIFIVFTMPDIKTSQRLKPHMKGVEIVKLTGNSGEPEWLIVTFKPGTVYWNRKTLFIPFEEAPTVQMVNTDDYTAALTVLKYDLKIRQKSGKIGVSIPNLTERTAGMPFTVHEVNRLILSLADFTDAPQATMPAAVASRNVELQA